MARVPEPDQTPDGPAYEGRLLVRPDDEVVDQGAGFDLRTVLTRRRILGLVGLGAGSLALAACSATASTGSSSDSDSDSDTSSTTTTTADGEIPEETNGPYPADGTNDVQVLDESGIVRDDITTSIGSTEAVDGVPLAFTFAVTDITDDKNTAMEGAAVYAWQCDAQGLYSMYSSGVEDETFLRGVVEVGSDGKATFQTIVPGCYTGRWTHIHFEVYPDVDSITDHSNVIATSQVAFPADMLADVYALDSYSGSADNLARVGSEPKDDDIFADSYELETATVSGSVDKGYTGSLAVAIDTSTTASVSGGGGAGGQPPSGGGGGQPPSGGGPDN